MRNSVVLPEPEGPSKAMNSPGRTSRLTAFTAATAPKRFVTRSIFNDMALVPSSAGLVAVRGGDLIAVTPFEQAL